MAQATITWADGSTTVEQLTPAGGNALQLALRNPGKPDDWGNNWVPEPKFFSSVVVTGLPPGYVNLLGNLQNSRVQSDGSVVLVAPTDFKYSHDRYTVGTPSHPAYAQAYGQNAMHYIDGGDTLYFRFVPQDDTMENALLSQVTMPQVQKAFEILDFDEQRIAQWPLLNKIANLYNVDDTTFSDVNLAGGTNVAWLLVPEHFITRWWLNSSVYLPAYKHWYGFGTKAASEGFSNEHYSHAAWFIGQALRLVTQNPGNAQAFEKAKLGINTGLYLLRYKIAYGLIQSDWNHYPQNYWRNEKSVELSARGTAGTQPGPAKEYDMDLCLAHVLFPSDPLITEAFNRRSTRWLTSGPEWFGSGGARQLGWKLENLLCFYQATGNVAFKNKAAAEITNAFSANVNGMTRLWFRESTPESPSFSEGVMTLTNCFRWVFDHGVRPDLQQHLRDMLAWYLLRGGYWNGPTKWKAAYHGDNATLTSCDLTFNSEIGSMFWLGLKRFADPSQIAQFNAMENQCYSAYSVTAFEADFGGLGPSGEKWLPMYMESSRR